MKVFNEPRPQREFVDMLWEVGVGGEVALISTALKAALIKCAWSVTFISVPALKNGSGVL